MPNPRVPGWRSQNGGQHGTNARMNRGYGGAKPEGGEHPLVPGRPVRRCRRQPSFDPVQTERPGLASATSSCRSATAIQRAGLVSHKADISAARARQDLRTRVHNRTIDEMSAKAGEFNTLVLERGKPHLLQGLARALETPACNPPTTKSINARRASSVLCLAPASPESAWSRAVRPRSLVDRTTVLTMNM